MTAVRWVSVLTLLLCAQCSRIVAVREQRVDAGLDGLERRERLNAKALELARAGVMPAKRQERPRTMDELPEQWKDRFSIKRPLGLGAFGLVYQVQATCDKARNDSFATVKVADKTAEAFHEVRNMRRMAGAKYVISTVGKPDYVEEDDAMYILMPYMNSGDFLTALKKCRKTPGCVCHKEKNGLCFEKMGGVWNNTLMLAFFYQAVQGVQEMNDKGLVHMDIKPENIMLNCASADPTSCSAYLIDLGVAGLIGTLMPQGSPGYMAPEVWKIYGSSQAANDIFSLGVVLYWIHHGRQVPFWDEGQFGDKTKQYNPAEDTNFPAEEDQSDLDRLVFSMLNPDFKARIGVAEVLERLFKILQGMPDFNEVEAMVTKTPKERGELPMPECVWDWKQPVKDIGDSKFQRNDCPQSEQTHATLKGIKECQCEVLRNGKQVIEKFDAPECL